MSRINFENKAAYITGGSRGLGLSLAWNLLERGAKVALVARNKVELARAREILLRDFPDGQVFLSPCDVTIAPNLRHSFDSACEFFGGIDLLINNAGAILVAPFAATEQEEFEAQMRLHLYAPIEAIRLASAHFKTRGGGRILNVCSLGGKVGVPHMSPYDASKFALAGFAQGIHGELALDNILMTTAFPTVMRTGSPIQAVFKGDFRKEFEVFETFDYLPVLSMSADKAAKKMLDAVAKGRSEVVLSPLARLRVLMGAVMPETSQAIMDWAAKRLPRDKSRMRRTGADATLRETATKEEVMYNQSRQHNADFNLGIS